MHVGHLPTQPCNEKLSSLVYSVLINRFQSNFIFLICQYVSHLMLPSQKLNTVKFMKEYIYKSRLPYHSVGLCGGLI